MHDKCKVGDVPAPIAKAAFAAPFSHRIYDPDGKESVETTGPGTNGWVPLNSISRYMQVAVILTEDGGSYLKEGFNRAQIKLAFVTDLKERRFARGASTLMMQLAKNLFQTRDKTLARKLEQVILTDYIAQTFTKSEVLELYLNLVEFGPNVYGVRAAAAHYFGKGPYNLTLAESLLLASMLPSPTKLHYVRHAGVPDAWMQSIAHMMDVAQVCGLITEAELAEGKKEEIVFLGGARSSPPASAASTGSSGSTVSDATRSPKDSRLD
jgi:membrane peptidoglycan carboxypeptidase